MKTLKEIAMEKAPEVFIEAIKTAERGSPLYFVCQNSQVENAVLLGQMYVAFIKEVQRNLGVQD
ncbi:hypothetical protein [Nitratidesulfovibrio liaohensis]|uniref:Uncharacterized protein n=1 Tax=Nitratidesulfovibrio liaohensis TaxID=2604158 RepID=A0ABY9R738_9BACT|nr:hypothetical protein [Nitratidesulfovibrio liaohensis]WMW66628.1 hypothetical protein KPS_001230 [Nitratidesulfovibrio liaohensis]